MYPVPGGWKQSYFSTRAFVVDREKLERYLPLGRGAILREQMLVKYLRRGFPRSAEKMWWSTTGEAGAYRLMLSAEQAWVLHPNWKPPEFASMVPAIIDCVQRQPRPRRATRPPGSRLGGVDGVRSLIARLRAWLVPRLHRLPLARALGRRLLRGRAVRQPFHGGVICLDAVEHSWLWTAAIRAETWDDDIQNRLLELSRGCQSLVDVGSNVGLMALAVALRNPVITIVCVEPNARAAALLRQSIAANRLDDRVTVLEAVAGAADGHGRVCGGRLDHRARHRRRRADQTERGFRAPRERGRRARPLSGEAGRRGLRSRHPDDAAADHVAGARAVGDGGSRRRLQRRRRSRGLQRHAHRHPAR